MQSSLRSVRKARFAIPCRLKFTTEAFAHSVIEAAEPVLGVPTTRLCLVQLALKVGDLRPELLNFVRRGLG